MLEILILYTLQKRERTLYAIRKDITDLFGIFTKPSIGAVYPALKKLTEEGCVSVYEKLSDGGKKFSYYSVTKKGIENFNKYYFEEISENPSVFYNQIQARIATMSLLKREERIKFIVSSKKQIEIMQSELERKINDEFLGADYFQKQLMHKTKKDLINLTDFLNNLKVDDDG